MTELTYDVSAGSGQLEITRPGYPNEYKSVSFQAQGDSDVDDNVTVQLQESNDATGGFKDITGAVATVAQNTNEYVDGGLFNGAYLQMDIDVGTATIGIITILVNYKE